MGIFIEISLDNSKLTAAAARQVAQLCPVDIFSLVDGQLNVHPDQEDECTLCELCLDVAPAGAITIYKTYKEEALKSRGRAA